MRALAKIAVLAFVSAIVWFGHHHDHPHYHGYAGPHDTGQGL